MGIAKSASKPRIPVCVKFKPAEREPPCPPITATTPAPDSVFRKFPKSAKIIMKSFFGLPLASTRMIFPFSRPRFFESSSRLNKSTVTTSPSAPPEGVEPTQPIASTCSGRVIGERSFASAVPRVQPRQIVYFSACTFSSPMAFIFAAAHSSDLRSLGEPVTREPMSSLNSVRYW